MANMELITSVTVGSGGAASVTLPASGTIPQTYTDLKIVYSARTNVADTSDDLKVLLNGSSASVYSSRNIKGNGSTAFSQSISSTNVPYVGMANGNTSTASTFGNGEFYFPNYTSTTTAKSMSSDAVSETNATSVVSALTAYLWNPATQAAITTIAISPYNGTAFLEGSTFYLYGISSVTSTPKATGGIVSQDATYWYHTFPFSSTFTPTQALSADILCIAGGGGGGSGGGGAGGLLAFTSQSLTTTGYTVTVGSGGAGASVGVASSNGGDSQFGALTLVKGGGRGSYPTFNAAGSQGSGGGGAAITNGTYQAAGTATSGQGNDGGAGPTAGGYYASGGGGGAGAAGGAGNNSVGAGAGGVGSSTYSSWGLATFTGQIVGGTAYFAGGGGGGADTNPALGGYGGGGAGSNGASTSGLVNTGGGGGGSSNGPTFGRGGSGLVIVRYAK